MNNLSTFFLMLFAAGSLCAGTAGAEPSLTARQQQILAASKLDQAAPPQFNGPRVVGIRPGTPLEFSLAVSGARPLAYEAKHLPAGLKLDSRSGILSGSLKARGIYRFTAFARNADGRARTQIRIVCGDALALTPPMGWNSYDTFGDTVRESEVLSNAVWLKAHLQPYGWDTLVVDFRWYDPKPTGDDRLLYSTRTGAALAADAFGRLLPAPNRFPSAVHGEGFKPLADQLHSMGLKFGIHVMRGIPRQAVLARTKIAGSQFTAADAGDPADKCSWCPDMFGVRNDAAGQAWYDSCARLWAKWGVDYIKVDDLSEPYHVDEIEMIHKALAKVERSIVFSTSPGPTPTSRAGHIAAQANLWRISGDFWDRWPKLYEQFDLLAQWQSAGAPGHWPDADMIPLGSIAIRSKLGGAPHQTHFTPDEQLSLMSLWALAPSPLMLGMNMPDNDAWTTALLTDPEVLALDQDALGRQAHRLFRPNQAAEMWVKKLSDGSRAVGFFNRTAAPVRVDYRWRNLGYSGAPHVRDLWLRQDLGRQQRFAAVLPPHGCVLLRVR